MAIETVQGPQGSLGRSFPTPRRDLLRLPSRGHVARLAPMDTQRAHFLDQLAEAIDAGDGRAEAILPMFQPWLEQLLQDPEAAKHEPGSAGHTARMFALRRMTAGSA